MQPACSNTSYKNIRRFRDRWNRTVVARIARIHNHHLKIKARIRAKGARGQNWYNAGKAEWARRKARSQSLWLVRLAGDWHGNLETAKPNPKPHLMRTMLVSNIDVTSGMYSAWSKQQVLELQA